MEIPILRRMRLKYWDLELFTPIYLQSSQMQIASWKNSHKNLFGFCERIQTCPTATHKNANWFSWLLKSQTTWSKIHIFFLFAINHRNVEKWCETESHSFSVFKYRFRRSTTSKDSVNLIDWKHIQYTYGWWISSFPGRTEAIFQWTLFSLNTGISVQLKLPDCRKLRWYRYSGCICLYSIKWSVFVFVKSINMYPLYYMALPSRLVQWTVQTCMFSIKWLRPMIKYDECEPYAYFPVLFTRVKRNLYLVWSSDCNPLNANKQKPK